MSETLNPLTGEALPKAAAEYVGKIRQVRSSARRAARSGNPAKRGDALRALAMAPKLILATYAEDHRRKVASL